MNEALRLLSELWSERARVGLVACGVLWGTLSLGLLLAFGTSMSSATSATADQFGVGLLRIQGNATTRSMNGMPAGRSIRLSPGDELPLAAIPGVRRTAYEYSMGGGALVEYAGNQRSVSVAGVSPGFGDLRAHIAQTGGRFLNPIDHAEARKVCFLGHRLAERLFGNEEAVGKTLSLDGQPFQVVGVGPPRITPSNYNGEDRDKLSIPASAFREAFGWRYASFLWVGLQSGANKAQVFAEVYRRLGDRLRFGPEDRDALSIQDYAEIRAMLEGIIAGNRIFTLIVGILGLFVAVVGVTNVMLALVEERTREFGVQLAIGAQPRLLAMERILEGVLITAVGGAAGLAACAGLLAVLARFPMPIEVQAYLGQPQLHVGLSLAVLLALVVSGALAGWLPARQAIRLQPADVLRDE